MQQPWRHMRTALPGLMSALPALVTAGFGKLASWGMTCCTEVCSSNSHSGQCFNYTLGLGRNMKTAMWSAMTVMALYVTCITMQVCFLIKHSRSCFTPP